MPIHGLSEQRRIPRLGKIKTGVLVVAQNGKSYPKAVDYFVCPPEVRKLYGEQPKELPVYFPTDDVSQLFPQELKSFRKSGLFCRGDGQRAWRWTETGDIAERTCPCELLESDECKPVATLNFLMPDVPGIGAWQYTTSSKNTIIGLNSAIETMHRTFGGLVGIPFTLKIVPQQTQRFDERHKEMVKTVIHVVTIDSQATFRDIWEWRKGIGAQVAALMPPPEPEGRALPSPEVVDQDTGHVAGGEVMATTESASMREELWSLFLESAGSEPTRALNLLRKSAKVNLNRVIDGLPDLSDDEALALLRIVTSA